jgi:hypothetical protein
VTVTQERLEEEFEPTLPPALIARVTDRAVDQLLRTARVKDFAPGLAYRDARAALRTIASRASP